MGITVREYLDKSPNDITCIYLNNCILLRKLRNIVLYLHFIPINSLYIT